MCMFCAAVPIAAATGTALDNKQRKDAQMQELQESPPKRLRPYRFLTLMVIFLLLVGSVIVHTRYDWLWI